MEIIHIILGKANPNRMNGVNKVVNYLAQHQTALGYQVSVWGITNTPNDMNYPARNYKTKLFQASAYRFRLDPKIITAIKEQNKNCIFHFHGGFIPEFYCISKYLSQQKLAYLLTPHGSYNTIALKRSAFLKQCYIRLFEKNLIRKAASVHCLGESEITGLANISKQNKYSLIPNGQDEKALQHTSKALTKTNSYIFGFCGRLDTYTKGLDLLLQAFAKWSTNKDVALWLIGDGKERKQLEALVKEMKLEEKVYFLGSQFGEEKLNTIAHMDVFFHPSRNEGIPTAVLEASGLGIPSIVSPESNLSNYINSFDAGIGMLKNDVEHLVAAMEKVYQNLEQKHHYSKNAKQMVKTVFNWETIAKQLITNYKEII